MPGEAEELDESRSFTDSSENLKETHPTPPNGDKTSERRDLRVRVCTWNVGGVSPGETDLSSFVFGEAKTATPDIFVFSFQELATLDSAVNNFVASLTTDDAWTTAIEGFLLPLDFVKLSSIRMCAMQLVVFVRRRLLPQIRNPLTSYTRTGFKGLLGNKGGVSIRFSVLGADLAFVGSHLSPHLHNAEERITDFAAIIYDQRFLVGDRGDGDGGRSPSSSPTTTRTCASLLDHDYVFFSGDLNFRLDEIPREEVLELIAAADFPSLLKHDQLNAALEKEKILEGFQEMKIGFPPTYKFDRGTDDYDTSPKQRKPAWCDRVLMKVKCRGGGGGAEVSLKSTEEAMKELEKIDENARDSPLALIPECYSSGKEFLISDHKPVGLTVSLKVFRDSLESPVHFRLPLDWKIGRDCASQFSVDGDKISDRWSWVGVFKSDFSSLADFVTWNYSTSAVVAKNEEEVAFGKKCFALTFSAKYVSSQGPHVLIYVSKNSVLGLSEVFLIA